jgi:hypothetical protein
METNMKFEAIYCFDTGSVRFAFHPEGADAPREVAEISEDALRDLFGASGDGESLVAACQQHFERIEAKAIERHRQMGGRPLRLEIADFTIGMATASGSPALAH